MRHVREWWLGYVLLGLTVLLICALNAARLSGERSVAFCYDRGMILVDTAAGDRCAPMAPMVRLDR